MNCTRTIGNIVFLFFSSGAISLKLHTSNVGVYCVSSANFSPTAYKQVWRTRSDTDISLVKQDSYYPSYMKGSDTINVLRA